MKRAVTFFVQGGRAEAEPLRPEPSVSELPPEFAIAKQFWETDPSKAMAAIQKYLKCSFEPTNIQADLSTALINPRQMDTSKVEMLWIDYSGDTFPLVSAEATFEMEFIEGITEESFRKWEDSNDEIIHGFTFYWDLHDQEVAEYFFLWSNSGSATGIDFEGA